MRRAIAPIKTTMVRYPLGIQEFDTLREEGYLYVDKTDYIRRLLEGVKYYFLSRPRRFGKSLFISTLQQFFLGNRNLFSGLAIDSWSDWAWDRYPIIRINLSEGSYNREDGLSRRLNEALDRIALEYGMDAIGVDPREKFSNLIFSLHGKFGRQVVILIDEYEKPLLDVIDKSYFERYREELAAFYSVLKSNEAKIKLLFLTGVTKFGHLNIFSGLNNLTDISLSEDFSAICGVTQQELEANFKEGIEKLASKKGLDYRDALLNLKKFYDGYHFSSDLIDTYNPYSLLNCLRESKFTDNWVQTGSSSFLLKKIRNIHFDLAELNGLEVEAKRLLGIDASLLDPVTLFYQSGYLTIKDYDKDYEMYTLGLPNYEVEKALYSAIIPLYLGKSSEPYNAELRKFARLMETGKAYEAMKWLKGYFANIPYDVKLDYEAEFQQVVYAFFALVGLMTNSTLEKQTSDGRIDMIVEFKDYVYIFEFKLGTDAQKALEQINAKNYALPWIEDRRKLIKIGVAFSPETRGIADFIIEEK